MHNGPLGKSEDARKTPMEQRESDRLEAPAKNQGRPVDPDQVSVIGAGSREDSRGQRHQLRSIDTRHPYRFARS
jgi:hypothetical protein